MDINKTFVEIAPKNAVQEGVQVDFQQGNASQIPFGDTSFDSSSPRGLQNFSEPVTLRKCARSRRGKSVIIDLRKDVRKQAIDSYIETRSKRVECFFMNGMFRSNAL